MNPEMLSMIKSIPSVHDAAVYGAEGLIASSFSGTPAAIQEVAAAARYLFRTASPAVETLEVAFAKRRVFLMPVGEMVVLLSADGDVDTRAVRELLLRASEEKLARVSAPPASSAEALATLPDLIAVLNAVTAAAKAHIGGAVIRNYLKKAQAELSTTHGALQQFSVDLQGVVSATDGASCNPELVFGAGVWVRLFLRKVSAVAPELARVDLDVLAAGKRDVLAVGRFFDVEKNV